MTTRQLDRLVTKTQINPASKRALKHVRQAVVSGRCGEPSIGTAHWSVGVDTREGYARMTFSFKRD